MDEPRHPPRRPGPTGAAPPRSGRGLRSEERHRPPAHAGEISASRPDPQAAESQLSVAPSHPEGDSPDRSNTRWLLEGVRYALPAAVVVAGLVVMALGSENDLEGGAGIVSAGLAIYFINWLFRQGVSGEGERDAEEAARDYFDKHGRWPGEGA
jgi:hypothetical protein